MPSPIDHWHALLGEERGGELCAELTAQQRARRLRFGDRVLCPFLRPFFLTGEDEARVTHVAETLWALGERVASVAIGRPAMLADLALSDDEIRLARIDPGYGTASTAGRADAFILPDSLQFAEYNAESPAGPAYSEGLAELFAELPLMARFRRTFDARLYRPVQGVLDALIASYTDWGGTAAPPQIAIVDWRDVPTYSEFELMRDAFVAAGVPTLICDPRDLEYVAAGSAGHRVRAGLYAAGMKIDLVYRRVLINDILAREADCRALLAAYEARTVCVSGVCRVTASQWTWCRICARTVSSSSSSRTTSTAAPASHWDGTPARLSGTRRWRARSRNARAAGSRRRRSPCAARPSRSVTPVASRCATCSSISRRTCSAGGSPDSSRA